MPLPFILGGLAIFAIIAAISSDSEDCELSEQAEAVWEKGQKIRGKDPDLYRKDKSGRIMKKCEYGNRKSEYGWEIGHSKPLSKGGSNHPNNLNPEHWRFNLEKGNKYPFKG